MANVCKATVDKAGGVISALGGVGFRINGKDIAVVDDPVADHAANAPDQVLPGGTTTHTNQQPKMKTGSGSFKVNGKSVCRTGDVATCGHVATGTSDFSVS